MPRPGRTTLHDPVCMRVRLTTLPKSLYHVLFLTNQRIPLTIVGLFGSVRGESRGYRLDPAAGCPNASSVQRLSVPYADRVTTK